MAGTLLSPPPPETPQWALTPSAVGTDFRIRAVTREDAPALGDFLCRLAATSANRSGSAKFDDLSMSNAKDLCDFFPLLRVSLVAVSGDRIIGFATYHRWDRGIAHVGLTAEDLAGVRDAGQELVRCLAEVGWSLGMRTFFGTVPAQELSVIAALTQPGIGGITSSTVDGMTTVSIELAELGTKRGVA